MSVTASSIAHLNALDLVDTEIKMKGSNKKKLNKSKKQRILPKTNSLLTNSS